MSDAGATEAGQDSAKDGGSGEPALVRSSHFTFHVFVCCNRRPEGHARGSCAAKGSERLRDYMKARAKELAIAHTRINSAGCLDRCELGPCVVIYPDAAWYRVTSEQDVDLVLQAHLGRGERPEALLLPSD